MCLHSDVLSHRTLFGVDSEGTVCLYSIESGGHNLHFSEMPFGL